MTIYYRGTSGHDRLKAKVDLFVDGDVVMEGYAGDDLLEGDFFHFTRLFGGVGNDTLKGGASGNLMDGGAGNDWLEVFWANSYSTLLGGTGNDYLKGGDGGALLDGGAGADRMEGGKGADVYRVDSISDIVIETYVPFYDNDPNPADLVESSVSWTLGGNLENLTLTGSGTINGTGNALANRMIGNSAANRLSGEGGADFIDGGLGSDTLDGGLGNDILNGGGGSDTVVFSGTAAATVFLWKTVAQVTGYGTDTLLQIEHAQGGAGNDQLTGSTGNNWLLGGGGHDRLYGLAGTDRLYGNAGADMLNGGQGNDRLEGGSGNDMFVFQADSGRDTITDFADGFDRIMITSGAKAWNDVTVADSGQDATVRFGAAEITLLNVDHAQLTAADFVFA